MAQPIVTVIGGSGFVGRLIARRFAKQGWRVRVAVRRPNEALFVRSYGAVGQVEPVQVNVCNEESVARVVAGAQLVVNCVGILYEDHRNQFEEIHVEAAERVARLAKESGAEKIVHISALGAAEDSPAKYGRSKYAGEQAVLAIDKNAIIMRPSTVFGGPDDLMSIFGKQAKMLPILPVISGDTRFQPIYVDDVAHAVEKAVLSDKSGIFELGGADVMTMREIVEYVNQETGRNRMVVNMPHFIARIMAALLSFMQLITFRIFKNHIIAKDQLRLLERDNVVQSKNGLDTLGITPTPMAPIMEPYLEAYRPRGEFERLIKPSI